MAKITREELEAMTIRQLRLIDIATVEDEAAVQEVLNSKLEADAPSSVDVSDLQKTDIKTPEDEARVQAEIDARIAASKEKTAAQMTPNAPTKDDVSNTDTDSDASEANQDAQTDEEFIDHVVTEDDIINNPDLAEQGIEVGETIQIPNPDLEAPEKTEVKSEEDLGKLKKDELIAYAEEIGLEFGGDVTNNPQRIQAILDFQKEQEV